LLPRQFVRYCVVLVNVVVADILYVAVSLARYAASNGALTETQVVLPILWSGSGGSRDTASTNPACMYRVRSVLGLSVWALHYAYCIEHYSRVLYFNSRAYDIRSEYSERLLRSAERSRAVRLDP